MRKAICTASIFVALVGGIVTGFSIQVPSYLWWCPAWSVDFNIPLPLWVWVNVATPIAMMYLLAVALCALWRMSAALCEDLRGLLGRIDGKEGRSE